MFPLVAVYSAQPDSSLWQVQKSEHFVVCFKEAPTGYIDELISKAELYYNSITVDLGFTRFDEFWTWDKRCKIFIYPTANDYHKATGQPSWSGGSADITKRTINTFLYEKGFNETVLPHEMTHLIFREFVGYKVRLPLWLDEGIASLQEKEQLKERLTIIQGLVISNLFIPIEKLNEITADNLVMPNIFYAESVSIVDFLFKKYGQDKFIDFCRLLRDKKDWRLALKIVYGFNGLSEMNDEWVKFLRATAGTSGVLDVKKLIDN
jgi:hypothetical protein